MIKNNIQTGGDSPRRIEGGCNWLENYPEQLFDLLTAIAARRQQVWYLAGGAVRDRLLGRAVVDLDLTVPDDAIGRARDFARELPATFVLLDEKEDVARVVWQHYLIDFSSFREGSTTIEDDLRQRDFTINAMAIPLVARPLTELRPDVLIDPTGGAADLEAGLVRAIAPENLARDPLRLLRAFRFMAVHGFTIEPATMAAIKRLTGEIDRVSMERLTSELHHIMAAPASVSACREMAACGLLTALFPELEGARGMQQPASHHLDVFEHGISALRHMELILQTPERFFPGNGPVLAEYTGAPRRRLLLKWAALFHDLGKTATRRLRTDRNDRITFYNHDRVGSAMFHDIARRFRWSRNDSQFVSRLIELHMWPFHLYNARDRQGVTRRALLRLVKAAGEHLPGLFLLALADSLASQGPERPPAMEAGLASLYGELDTLYLQVIKPVLDSPRLLTGYDLKSYFALEPGPVYRKLFDALEQARVAGEVSSRAEALEWAGSYLARTLPGES